MNEPHEDCLSVTFNGLLYVFGGRSNDQISRQSFECYNPETNKWTVLEPLCPNNIKDWLDWDIVAVDGWIIVRETENKGGRDFANFYRYNIDKGKWKSEKQEVEDKTTINFCVVKKEVILPYSADVQGERKSLVKRYFDQLSQQETDSKLFTTPYKVEQEKKKH